MQQHFRPWVKMLRIADLELFAQRRAGQLHRRCPRSGLAAAWPGGCGHQAPGRDLDVRLFARTTRSLRLTAEGERYLPTALNVLESLRQGHEDLHGNPDTLRGTLQVSAPSDMGRNMLLPWLSAFRREHPALQVRFFLSDQIADLNRDPVDVAIRYGHNQDANYIALPLAAWNRRVLVASPDYLARHGRPLTPMRCNSMHACCTCSTTGCTTNGNWATAPCRCAGRWSATTPMSSAVWPYRVKASYKSWLDVSANIATGELEVVLPGLLGESTPVTLVCPHRKQLTPAVTQLHLWLRERFEALREPALASGCTIVPD